MLKNKCAEIMSACILHLHFLTDEKSLMWLISLKIGKGCLQVFKHLLLGIPILMCYCSSQMNLQGLCFSLLLTESDDKFLEMYSLYKAETCMNVSLHIEIIILNF